MIFLINLIFFGSSLDDVVLVDSFLILEIFFVMGKKNIMLFNILRVVIFVLFDLIFLIVFYIGRIVINI